MINNSPLTETELRTVMNKIDAGYTGFGSVWQGLEGIDAQNTAPLFDIALESLVQQYSWSNDMVDYERRDLRDEAIHRALWSVLLLNGYVPFGTESQLGDWDCPGDEEHFQISECRNPQ